MLGVRHSVTNDVLQEDLENPSGFFIYEAAYALHTSSASEPSYGGLGDPLDVVPQHLPVPLGSALTQPLSSLSSPCHFPGKFKFSDFPNKFVVKVEVNLLNEKLTRKGRFIVGSGIERSLNFWRCRLS
ncbi:hypothetical protein ACFX1R_040308 [Malus domestica]